MTDSGLQRVVLVGFMACGKSTVGPHLARALGWRFVDMDHRVEKVAGRSIPEIFAQDGEARFRQLEEDVGTDLMKDRGVVIGSGGGWAARPGRLSTLPAGTVSVWLRVSAEEAVRRAGNAPGERPLLDGAEPLQAARQLLASRLREYSAATLEVDTEAQKPEDVSARILEFLVRRFPEVKDNRLRSPNAQ